MKDNLLFAARITALITASACVVTSTILQANWNKKRITYFKNHIDDLDKKYPNPS